MSTSRTTCIAFPTVVVEYLLSFTLPLRTSQIPPVLICYQTSLAPVAVLSVLNGGVSSFFSSALADAPP